MALVFNITNPVTKEKIGEVVNGAASATPNDTDLVMSVDTSVAKKNTWTQIKAFLKTYFDTIYQAAGTYLTSANITQTITNGVTDKAPSEDAVYDALATKTSFLSLKALNFSPADGQNYHFVDAEAPNINATIFRFYCPSDLIIKKAYVCFFVYTTLASNETSSIYIRVNNTTDTLISNAVQPNATSTVVSNTALNLAVSAGSYFNIKWATPAWVLNPANMQINVVLEISNG